ncbi:MAG: hypothetical protein OEQ16_09825 [Gammaproteobacteria bacterium]|jgi:hypothetical protein|nr:hypothetical protein [Gammaproteobacteria bacterium]
MKFRLNVWWWIIVFAGLTSCSTTLTSVDGKGGNVYALPPTVVDQMLQDAMSTEISSGTLRRGSTPYPSYLGEVTWGSLDKDTITASARPAKGRKLDGTVVDGYVFEVSRKGTAPATGEPTVKRIFAKLQKDAELTGTGAAFVEFSD